MRSPGLILFLAVTNVVLACLAAYAWMRPAPPAPILNPPPAWLAAGRKEGPRPRLVETVVTNEFKWGQLESEDYRTYIKRLRSIGCPEETIKDIVIADLDKLMSPRVASSGAVKKQPKYWQDDEKELIPPSAFLDEKRQKREIDFEKREMVRELLGLDLAAERARTLGEEDRLGERLPFLSAEKKSKVRMIMERYAQEEVALREKSWLEGEKLGPEDLAKIRELQAAQQREVGAALTPAEMEKYELWHSPVAQKVRQSTFGMDASEGEFLSVYSLRKGFEETWGEDKADLEDPQVKAGREKAEAELNRKIEEALGPKRYGEYVRAQDPDFHAMSVAAAQFQLPQQVASDVYELKKAAVAEQEAIVSDESLSKRQKKAALSAVEEETARAARAVMGDRAFNYFKRHAQGGWLGEGRQSPLPGAEP